MGQPACLDFGDKVVRQSAVCFDSYTCNYDGFVCKSDMKKVVDAYDLVILKHNTLVNVVNGLKNCLRTADTLDDAQRCADRY